MSNESINKFVVSGLDDAITGMGLPEEALALLMNMKDADKPKEPKVHVFSNSDEALNHSSLNQDALSLLMSIKEADKIIEKNLTNKREAENNEIISKMTFNPEKGFTIDPNMLAKLNILSSSTPPPPPPKEESSVFVKVEEPIGINISNTNQYTMDEATSIVRSFNISEEGVFLGIIMGVTNKSQAIDTLSKYSSYKYDVETSENILTYDDISITIYFDDENVVNQLEFGKSFRGNTSKGLKIGDTIENAIALYGNPTMKSPKGAFWKNLKVFCSDGYITSIKLQK